MRDERPPDMIPISCYLVGSDTLLLECAAILLDGGHDLRGVVTSEERIRTWCRERGVRVIEASGGWGAALREAPPFDVLFSITHLSIIPDEILGLPHRMAVNFHDGPLPRYAGLNAPVWALLNQEREYGITWHVMTPGVDEGPILEQVRFPLTSEETAQSLNTRCLAEAVASFPALVGKIAEGCEEPVPQDLSKRTVYRRFDRPAAGCLVDWSASSAAVQAFVRALSFGPHPNPVGLPKAMAGGARPFVVEAVVPWEGASEGAVPGRVLASGPEGVVVATGDGAVIIAEARCLNGAALSPEALQVRHGLAVGATLVGHESPEAHALGEADRRLARQEPFWSRRLIASEPTQLPVGTPAATMTGRGRLTLPLERRVPPEIAPSSVWLSAAVAVVLARLGERDQVEFALPGAAEAPEEFYLRWVPASISLDPMATVEEVVEQARRVVEEVRERGGALRDLRIRIPALATGARPWPIAVAESKTDEVGEEAPLLVVRVTEDGSSLEASYAEGPLGAEDARTLVQAVASCLDAAVADPRCRWVGLALAEEDSSGATHLSTLNATDVAYDRDSTVSEQLVRQAGETPDRTAVFFEGTSLSYQDLLGRARVVAQALQLRGVGVGDLVGIHVDRSLELPVAVLGVLLAGAAYLPLDPDFPEDRLAFMLDDADVGLVLTREALRARLPESAAGRALAVEELTWGGASRGEPSPESHPATVRGVGPHDLAYAIYTSGSTGRPKGVLVEHRNVVNFFAAMDRVIPGSGEEHRVWLAVTSLSFDISVLELLWTLARGFEVVVHRDRTREEAAGPARTHIDRPMAFGLFMWGNDDGPGPSKYRLMLEGARYFDENGFDSVWTPERHFHAFGGPFPNPSVTGAALAATTCTLKIRSGSCVSPLHHPIRIAEEWGVVDNLSNGRVGLAFAAGWQPNDFIIRPDSYGDQKSVMVEQLETVRRLWRGEPVEFENPAGEQVAVTTLPRPVQAELPVWVTTAGNVETYRLAGSMGANVLTHLLGQSVEEVGEKIAAYREARAEAGLDPASGIVSLMLHTFVGESDDAVREIVREPMKDYLRSSIKLILGFAWTFPAFRRPGGDQAQSPADVDLESLTEEEIEAILDFAFDRYFEGSGLFGTPETCARMVDQCKGVGVDEIACLLDFGVETEAVLESLPRLKRVRDEANAEAQGERTPPATPLSIEELVRDRRVSHLQCTPSMARMLLQDPSAGEALKRIPHLFIGGEALPEPLAEELTAGGARTVTNMYGPTETTIWSLSHRLAGPGPVPIGQPVANTRIHVLDRFGRPVPPGVPGHLWIAGDGVARGYHGRPELTAKRFLPDLYDPAGGRMYRTGDRVCVTSDGTVEFLGRVDHQVKVRGYRIELGEIEVALEGAPGVDVAAAAVRSADGSGPRIEAFVSSNSAPPSEAELKAWLRKSLPDYMVPGRIVVLERLPLTPNGKIDRNALPSAGEAAGATAEYVAPSSEVEERIASCWRETLGVEQVGVQDNFFDIGGHSLLVVRLHRELQAVLSPSPTLVDLYRFPTVRSLSEHLADGDDPGHLKESHDRASRRRERMGRRRRKSS